MSKFTTLQKCPHCRHRGTLSGDGSKSFPYTCSNCGGLSSDVPGSRFVAEILAVVIGIFMIYVLLTYTWPFWILSATLTIGGAGLLHTAFWPKQKLMTTESPTDSETEC